MSSKTRIDELNIISTDTTESMSEEAVRKVLKSYYEPMQITDEQKEDREELAYDLYLIFFLVFTSIQADYIANNEIDLDYYSGLLSTRLYDEINSSTIYLENNEVINAYIPSLCNQIVNTTVNHIDSEYFTSQDRSVNVAKTEANVFLNADDYDGVLESGYTYKIWCTQGDSKVRDIHRNMEGIKIPIDEYFVLDNGDMLLYPCDVSMNPSDDSIANCRCSLDYE